MLKPVHGQGLLQELENQGLGSGSQIRGDNGTTDSTTEPQP